MGPVLSAARLGLVGVLVALPTLSVWAETADVSLAAASSSNETSKTEWRRRNWSVREFSSLRLAPREAGSALNEHPARIDGETLRQLLAQLRTESREGSQPLFAPDELAEVTEPLTQALANASADDDVLLLSSSRRGGGLLTQPMAVTARLFVQGGHLNVIVNDTRFEFYNRFRATGTAPEFTFGSRQKAGAGVIQAGSGASRRPDWVALSLAANPRPAPSSSGVPAAAVLPAGPAPVLAAEPAPAALPRARDPHFADEIEQRLLTLKRLRDKGLISEEEYQNKRNEILRLL